MNQESNKLVFRPPRTADEMRHILLIRKQVAEQADYGKAYRNRTDEFALDPWDRRSIHLGLFVRQNDIDVPVGYQRGVTSDFQDNEHLDTVLKRQDGTCRKERKNPPEILPSVDWAPEPNKTHVRRFTEDIIDAEASIMESTRTAILPEWRRSNTGRFYVECVLAFYLFHKGFRHGLMSVSAHHRRYYQAIGFDLIPGTQPMFYPRVGVEGVTLAVTRETIRPKTRRRVENYAEQLDTNGEVSASMQGYQRNCSVAPSCGVERNSITGQTA